MSLDSAMYSRNSLILIDAHVHLHSCFPINQVLNNALQNFQSVARNFGNSQSKSHQPFAGCLLLAEMTGQSWFQEQSERITQQNGSLSLGTWKLIQTSEPLTLMATHETGQSIWMFAGRQVVTVEGLEVLALLTHAMIPDGQSLVQTLQSITNVGGVAVIPWGVGKWIGRRGALIDTLLQQEPVPLVCLGDNSGRPLWWPYPSKFHMAQQKGLHVLQGTDPLPLPSEVNRPGSFGLAMFGELDPSCPGKTLKTLFTTPSSTFQAYGDLENPWRFVRNQVALRLNK
jgi:hypothetical protein